MMDKDVTKRAMKWLQGHNTGASSEALLAYMLGGDAPKDHPHDGGDLGRCLRLLEACPEWEARIPELITGENLYWRALAARWADLKASDADGDYSATYNLMRKILDPIEKADKSVIRLGEGVTMRFS